MVEEGSRKHARALLKKVALGKMTNYECEDEFADLLSKSKDPVIFALFRTIRELSGDAEEGLSKTFCRKGEMRKRLSRWILFLETNLEYEWPKERLAPGLRDFYRPNWFDKLLGIDARTNAAFCSQGEYHVWSFFREDDFHSAKEACAQRKKVIR